MNIDSSDTGMDSKLRSILLWLARREMELAANEAAATPYWSVVPSSVVGHRAVAALLRTEADRLLAENRCAHIPRARQNESEPSRV